MGIKMTETILYHKHQEGNEVIITVNGDAGIEDMIEAFKRFLLAISYSEKTVNEYLGDE